MDLKNPRLWIGGRWPETSATKDVLNTATGEVLAQVPIGDVATVEAALAAAQEAFRHTRKQAAHQRATFLRAIAQGIEQRRSEFADLIVAEAGKPITFAEAEVARAIMTFTAAAEAARHQHAEVLDVDAFPSGQGHFGVTSRCPLGVSYGISP